MKFFREKPDTRRDKLAVPLRTVLLSMAAFWLCYFVLATARGLLIGFEGQDELLVRRLVVTLASVAVTVLLWLLLRAFDDKRLGLRFAIAFAAALPASLLIAAINSNVFRAYEERAVAKMSEESGVRIRQDTAGNILVDIPDTPYEIDPSLPRDIKKAMEEARARNSNTVVIDRERQLGMMWLQLTDVALGRYFLLLAWAALYFAMTQAEHARAAERREGEYRRAAKAAELKSLRYQVNPHFLFNTLNSLSALVMVGRTDQAEEMIQALSRFYRRSLSSDPTDDVALAEEIELQRIYLEIEGVRFPERLLVDIDLPAELAGARVPGMILQPLVENSVRYAVSPVSRPVTIRIAAREEYERLVVTISDDGPGASDDGKNGGFGIGLANVKDRLAARFGEEASVVSGPAEHGWRTVIRMPLSRDDLHEED
ncbi:sensor histidine kinase [Croceicoccus naphthovorans]|uniref:Histidine kinase n=1 Tax=Croceicoccus naphthovorans TaxID=1348774 RepID=A0A0G3XK48_9SPHN|nr:histidine kinase [Croceicoccus naphthovorans]AKM11945.1 histidine kinase [Croceicoccus naphthovorans]MBB3989875.1 two-component sensor histidine kinase [Croceicoccus naphthovorans]